MPRSIAAARRIATKNPIPLFAEKPSHPFAPLACQTAAARSEGQGRPPGRRLGALPLTEASTVAGWQRSGRTALFMAVIFTVLLPSISTANADSVVLPQPPSVTANDPFSGFVIEAAQRFNIPAAWIWDVMRVESDDDASALSPKGAIGLMQIMPETYQDMRLRYGLGADPYNPRDNILAGTAYLREMLDCYGMAGFLAAYNAGPEQYDEHLTTGRPLPVETQAYIAMLMPIIEGERTGGSMATAPLAVDPLAWMLAPLFVNRAASANPNIPESSASVDRLSTGVQPNRISISDGGDFSALAPQPAGLFIPPSAPDQRQ